LWLWLEANAVADVDDVDQRLSGCAVAFARSKILGMVARLLPKVAVANMSRRPGGVEADVSMVKSVRLEIRIVLNICEMEVIF
jgi:hypothetical protein